MSCIFCKIVNREIPAKIHYEDENFMAFDDIVPKAPVHILLITKRHIDSVDTLIDTDADLMGKMIMTAQKVAREVKLTSYRLVINTGQDAGQEVAHLHMHILGGKKLGNIC